MSGKIDKIYMSSSLAKVNNDLQNSSSTVVSTTATHVQDVVDRLINKQVNLFQRFFPDNRMIAVNRGELALVKTEFEYIKKAFDLVRETQIQSLQEVCNQYLIQAKASSRSATAAFLIQKSAELQEEMARITDELIKAMDKRIQNLEQLHSSTLQEMRLQQIYKEIDVFIQLQTHLLEQFQHILYEGV